MQRMQRMTAYGIDHADLFVLINVFYFGQLVFGEIFDEKHFETLDILDRKGIFSVIFYFSAYACHCCRRRSNRLGVF